MYARPTAPAQVLDNARGAVGGVDLSRGGTWMGVTPRGFVVAVTNQRTYAPPRQAPRSRGEIVMEALRAESTSAIRDWLQTLNPADYNPFNLLFGNDEELLVAYGRERIRVENVAPGLSVLPNDELNAPNFAKVERAKSLLQPNLLDDGPELLDRLATVLADRWRPPLDEVRRPPEQSPFSHEVARELEALCIRTPAYGTRSSIITGVGGGKVLHYLYADGAPDETSFVDRLSLFSLT
jgi:uncharacterized protein with NRDE domain